MERNDIVDGYSTIIEVCFNDILRFAETKRGKFVMIYDYKRTAFGATLEVGSDSYHGEGGTPTEAIVNLHVQIQKYKINNLFS